MSIHHPHMTTAEIHRQILGERNNVVIPKIYIEFVKGDYVAAVVLKEIVWGSGDYSQTADRDGWMYNSEKDWQDHHFLSRKQVNRSIAHINTCADASLIDKKVSKRTTPNGDVLNENVTYYRLDNDIYERIFGSVQGGRFGNVPEGSSGNVHEGKSLTINTGTDTGTNTIVQNNTNDGVKTPSMVQKEYDQAVFDKFWSAYPRKVAKGDARKAFNKVIKTVPLHVLIDSVEKHKKSEQWKDPKFIPHPATWLNGERWEDDVTKPVAQGGGQVVRKADTEASQKAWDDIMRPLHEN